MKLKREVRMRENYLLRQSKKPGIKIEKTEPNSIYELMKDRPRHKVRSEESEFRATDVPMIRAGMLKGIRRY